MGLNPFYRPGFLDDLRRYPGDSPVTHRYTCCCRVCGSMLRRMGCPSSSRKAFRRGYPAGRRLTLDISERTPDCRNLGSGKNGVLRVVIPCLRVLLVRFDTPRRLFYMLITETQCFSPVEFSVLSAPKNFFKLACVTVRTLRKVGKS
jgi:hypothetical protein